jgi:hypothetical protein
MGVDCLAALTLCYRPGIVLLDVTHVRSHFSKCAAIAVHEHQEADLRIRANLPTPGKVETAKAGCGHESGNQEGRIAVVLLAVMKEDLAVTAPAQPSNLPIEDLISSRSQELDIGPVELVRRCGYKNLAKGLRRLEELRGGEFESTRGLISGLPQALDVPAEVVQKAVEDTTRQLHEAQEAAWRAAFKPHAIILTDRKIPQPIFVAAMIGVDELLRIDFPPLAGPETYRDLAVEGICSKLARWNRDFNLRKGLGSYQLPAFGRPVGFVVNYSPDHAVSFDLDGHALETLSTAHRLGHATLHLKGSSIPLSVVLKIGSSE